MSIIDLALGDPSGMMPNRLAEAYEDALLDPRANHYSAPFSGQIETRQAVTRYYGKRHRISLDAGQVSITHGARPAILFALKAAGRSGKRCGFFTPAFPAFPSLITDAGLKPVPVVLPAGRLFGNWLEEVLRDLRDGIFLFNNPHNPTGRVFTDGEVALLCQKARAHNVKLVSDAVYIDLYEGHAPASLLHSEPEAVEVISISKPFKACGMRVGALVGDADWIGRFSKIYEQMNGVPPVLQHVARVAWTEMPDVTSYRQGLATRRKFLVNSLRQLGWTIDTDFQNEAGSFVWGMPPPGISAVVFCNALAEQGVLT